MGDQDPNPPNQTLFVGNLDHSLKRDDLLHCLHELYCPFGRILEIKISRQDKITRKKGIDRSTGGEYPQGMRYMKTIAFIVFESANVASMAKGRTNRFPFFGREIYVQYAKSVSDTVALMDGTHTYLKRVQNQQNQGQQANGHDHRDNRKKQKKGAGEFSDDEDDYMKSHINQKGTGASALAADKKIQIIKKGVDIEKMKKQALKNAGQSGKLVVEGLVGEFTEEIMRPLFEQFPGLVVYSHFPDNTPTIQLEFSEPQIAACCLKELNGFNVDGRHILKVKYNL